MSESKYSIHDLSRAQALNRRDLPRYNMSFELGIDKGCRQFGDEKQQTKKFLILEKKEHYTKEVLSDVAGWDLKAHGDNVQTLVKHLRDWIIDNVKPKVTKVEYAFEIWSDYNIFLSDLQMFLPKNMEGTPDIDEIPNSEFIMFVQEWIDKKKKADTKL